MSQSIAVPEAGNVAEIETSSTVASVSSRTILTATALPPTAQLIVSKYATSATGALPALPMVCDAPSREAGMNPASPATVE